MSNRTILGGPLTHRGVWAGLALATAACFLAGCGQKGPLYMGPAYPKATPAPATPATTDDKSKTAPPVSSPAR